MFQKFPFLLTGCCIVVLGIATPSHAQTTEIDHLVSDANQTTSEVAEAGIERDETTLDDSTSLALTQDSEASLDEVVTNNNTGDAIASNLIEEDDSQRQNPVFSRIFFAPSMQQ